MVFSLETSRATSTPFLRITTSPPSWATFRNRPKLFCTSVAVAIVMVLTLLSLKLLYSILANLARENAKVFSASSTGCVPPDIAGEVVKGQTPQEPGHRPSSCYLGRTALSMVGVSNPISSTQKCVPPWDLFCREMYLNLRYILTVLFF